jgi:hypothetical protein
MAGDKATNAPAVPVAAASDAMATDHTNRPGAAIGAATALATQATIGKLVEAVQVRQGMRCHVARGSSVVL